MENFNNDIVQAIEVLNKGGIILYPTDTIWGIGCDATNEAAVKKIYAIKQREDSKSMLVLVDKDVRLNNYVKDIPEMAYDLIDLSEKPITIIYDGARNLAAGLMNEDGSVGIRVSREPFTQKLIERLKKPIVSTSANISGQNSPAFFDQISEDIKKAVDYIVSYRQKDRTPATQSSIIKLRANGEIKIIRE